MQMFAQCENVEEAHKLSAHVFGIQHVRHFRVNLPRSTDSINSGVFDEPPSEYELKPHTRTYKPRIHKSGFESKALEKLAQRNQYLKKLEEDRKLVIGGNFLFGIKVSKGVSMKFYWQTAQIDKELYRA